MKITMLLMKIPEIYILYDHRKYSYISKIYQAPSPSKLNPRSNKPPVKCLKTLSPLGGGLNREFTVTVSVYSTYISVFDYVHMCKYLCMNMSSYLFDYIWYTWYSEIIRRGSLRYRLWYSYRLCSYINIMYMYVHVYV